MPKRIALILAFLGIAVLVIPNTRSLYEGIFFYLRDVATYEPNAVKPIHRNGRFIFVYDMVALQNAERLQYLRQHLALANATIIEIPIPQSSQVNLFVRFNSSTEPLTIFSAHYDKLFDEVDYQGASDNTAAVSVLLDSVVELAQRGNAGNRAFLFLGEEETGLRGASAFVEYARANKTPIREIVNFDNIGRGNLAIRPSAPMPGFIFTIPFWSDVAYDGHKFGASPVYPLSNARVTQLLTRIQPQLVVYEKFTALSDSNIFQQNGIATVAISSDNMHYLEQTWHTYADRVELLDERNLDLALDLIINSR